MTNFHRPVHLIQEKGQLTIFQGLDHQTCMLARLTPPRLGERPPVRTPGTRSVDRSPRRRRMVPSLGLRTELGSWSHQIETLEGVHRFDEAALFERTLE